MASEADRMSESHDRLRFCVSAVLSAWHVSKFPAGPQRAAEMARSLEQLEEAFKATGDA
jgi:hypothetical protein